MPRQQRFGQYTRSLMKALDVPAINLWGLHPAQIKGTGEIAPLKTNRDIDSLGLLNGVSTFNFHPRLPHYALTTEDTRGSMYWLSNPLIWTARILSQRQVTQR